MFVNLNISSLCLIYYHIIIILTQNTVISQWIIWKRFKSEEITFTVHFDPRAELSNYCIIRILTLSLMLWVRTLHMADAFNFNPDWKRLWACLPMFCGFLRALLLPLTTNKGNSSIIDRHNISKVASNTNQSSS